MSAENFAYAVVGAAVGILSFLIASFIAQRETQDGGQS